MAVLAGDALLAGGRGTVLLPHHFQLDARLHGHLMARDTELGFRELIEIASRDVDVLPRPLFVGRGFDFEFTLVGDHFRDAAAANRTVDRGKDIAGLDATFAVDFAVALVHPMAGDAGHSFAGNLWQIPQRCRPRDTQAGSYRRVAAVAEVTDRALGRCR